MKKLLLKTMLLLCALIVGEVSPIWADVTTYIFTSKSWTATVGGSAANWTSGQDGAGFSNNGIQVTTAATGANATSPISFSNISEIVLTYNTNKSKGAGTAKVKIGTNNETSKDWAYSSGDGTSANYTLTYSYATPQSGNVKITLNTTTNSIYLVSCKITYGGGSSTYSVTYDGNGNTSGDVPEDDNDYEIDDEVTVLGNTGSLAKTGCAFGGWNTQADGEGTNYSAGATFSISSNTTLYAKWNPYTITATSNNGSYGTVSGTTTITASPTSGYRVIAEDGGYTVTSGTATVVNNGDNTFTVTPTSNCTVQINFEAIPTHSVTFSVNGNTSRTAAVAEGSSITFPTAVETTPGDGEFAKVINGQTFQGWYTSEYSNASVAPSYVNTASATMSTSDVTYYAVYADVGEEDSEDIKDAVKSQTLQYDTWTYGGTSSDKSSYRLFGDGGYVQSAAFDLSKLMKVIVYGGTYGGETTYKTGTIGDGTNKWDDITLTGTGNSKAHTFTGTSALSGTKALYITSTCGNGSNQGLRISKVEIYVKGKVTTKTNFTTDNRASAGIAFANASVDVKLTSGYTGQALTNTNSVSPITYSSSDETVATINSSTGAITELLKAGTTTITASYAGNATYKPAEVSYDLNVTEKTPHGLAYATDAVEKLTTDAAFTNTLTNGHSLSVAYSSSATSVATVNSSTGEVTIKGAGETTITATFAGDEDYESGSATYTLTVSKATPTLTFASANATLRQGKDFEGNALTNPAGLTVSYSSGTTSVATVNSSTGAPTFVAAGSTTITASFSGNDTYTSAEATYTLKVLAAPTISLSADDVDWGDTYTFDASGLSSYGDVTLTSGESSIATVDGLVITPVAVGKVTITVSTAENETYDAGSATFDLTINAPEGSDKAPSSEVTYTFDFTDNTGWGIPSTSTTTGSTYTYDGKTVSLAAVDGYKYNTSTSALLLGKENATLTLPAFDKPVTKISTKAVGGASGKVTQNIYVGSTAVSTEVTGATNDQDYAIASEYQAAGTIYTLKVTNDNNTQIGKLTVHMYQAPSATVTINKYGYATYCSVNPIDFTSTTGYTAWRVNSIASDGTITFKKITEKIKGGQGVLLYNKDYDEVNTTNVTVAFADGSTVFDNGSDGDDDNDNLLIGTTAATNVAAGAVYGLSNNKFVKSSAAGNIPAGKAYIDASSIPASVKSFTFVFEETDGVREIRKVSREVVDQIFDLSGRRQQKMQRGINIVNGKKVVVK